MADESTILNFYNTAKNREFARKFMFRVITLGPFTTEDLIYITTAKMPGRTIVAKEVKFAGYPLQLPGAVTVENASWEVTFRCDEAHNIRRRALAWQDEIFSIQKTGEKFGTPSIQSGVFQYLTKEREKPHGFITLHGIFPTKVGDVEYDITDDGEVATFPVTFAYQFWTDSNALATYQGIS
jgi:hypothetical protein